MLTSLQISNFMKHEELEVSFSPQETLIVGENWAGKSTILKAILYALFGPSAIPGGAGVIRRRGTKATPSVTLKFSLNGAQYTVIRKQTTSRLLQGDTLLASGPASVTSMVEDLLGMPARLFIDLRTSPQDEVGAILTLGIGKLNKIIGQITKAELIEKIQEKLKARILQTSAELGALPKFDLDTLSRALDLTTQQLNEDYAILQKADADRIASNSKSEKAIEALKQAHLKVEQHHTSMKQREALNTACVSLSDQLKATEEELALEVSNTQTLQETYTRLEQRIWQVQTESDKREKNRQRLMQLRTECETRQETLANLRNALKEAEQSKPFEGSITEKLNRVLELQREVGQLEERARASEKAAQESVCPTCLRPYEGMDTEALKTTAAQAERAYSETYNTLATEQQVLELLKKNQHAYDERLDAVNKVEQSLLNLETEMGKLEAETSLLHEDADDLDVLQAELAKAKTEYEEARTLETRKTLAIQKSSHLRPQLEQAKKDLEKIQIVERPSRNELAKLNQAADVARVRGQKDAEKAASLSASYTAAYQHYERQVAELKAAQAAEQDREQKKEQAKLLDKLTIYLDRAYKDFIDRTWASILGYTSEFVARCTGGVVENISIEDGKNFFYTEHGQKGPIAAASGYQRACIGVGIRLALAEAVRAPASITLLDEVTAGATDVNSMAMAQALSQVGQQVIMVSHRQSDAAVANQVIHVGPIA